MVMEQTVRDLATVRDEVKTLLADESLAFFDNDDLDLVIRDAAGDVAHDVHPDQLPQLRVRETFATTSGTNVYNFNTGVASTSYSLVKVVSMTMYGLPVIKITEREKFLMYGNPTNWPASSRPPHWYDSGNGRFELYNYGTSTQSYPPDIEVVVEYIKQPNISESPLPLIDSVANLLVEKAAIRMFIKNRLYQLARDANMEYMRRVAILNQEAAA